MKMSVEVAKARTGCPVDTVFVGVDKEALQSLIDRLTVLHRQKTGDHIHLMSEEWGPGDLIAKPIVPGNYPIHHMKILLVE